MILWRNIENYPFLSYDSDPRFPPFLLYVRWKSGVTFVRRCFRDEWSSARAHSSLYICIFDYSHVGFEGIIWFMDMSVTGQCSYVNFWYICRFFVDA